MSEEPTVTPEITEKIPHRNAPKRDKGQAEIDAVFIAKHYARGRGCRWIAIELNKERTYTLSFKTIHNEIRKLNEEWRRQQQDFISTAKSRQLHNLDELEGEIWDAWERSKAEEIQRTVSKGGGASSEKQRDILRKATRDGDAAFTRQILDIHAERAKLLGLYEPTKTETSGPNGGPIAIAAVSLSDEAQEAILRRHFERTKGKSDERTRIEPEPNSIQLTPATSASPAPSDGG